MGLSIKWMHFKRWETLAIEINNIYIPVDKYHAYSCISPPIIVLLVDVKPEIHTGHSIPGASPIFLK